MAKKRRRKSRQSKGIHGNPKGAKTSVGMKRLLNQLEAHLNGKNTRVVLPASQGPGGITITRQEEVLTKFGPSVRKGETITLTEWLERRYLKFESSCTASEYKTVSGRDMWDRKYAGNRKKGQRKSSFKSA